MADTPFKDADGTSEPRFVLARIDEKHYLVDTPFLYVEPIADRPADVGSSTETGLQGATPDTPRRFRVPATGGSLTTDLASVPPFLTWLVPKDGRHTPAALLHDALMPSTVKLYDGPQVDRVEADRIFRNAMQHLGVPFLRRWIIWSAVSMATFVGGRPRADNLGRRVTSLARLLIVAVFVVGVLFLGASMWADVLDRQWPDLPILGHWPDVPGMGTRGTLLELRNGLGLAAIIAVAAGLIATVLRGVSEVVRLGNRRSWLRAIAFLVAPSVLIPFAVPVLAATAGWVVFQVVEAIALVPQLLTRWVAAGLGASAAHSTTFARFSGPINVPGTSRRL